MIKYLFLYSVSFILVFLGSDAIFLTGTVAIMLTHNLINQRSDILQPVMFNEINLYTADLSHFVYISEKYIEKF